MATLFVGRFQPLHNGHLSVIEQYSDVVIAIGSSQYSGTADNPLSVTERQHCLEQVFQGPIVAVPDLHDDAHWVEHLLKIVYTVTPTVDRVVSGNPWTIRLCQAAGLEVVVIKPTIAISSTQIRQWIRQHNPIWKQYVPSSIHQLIEGPISSRGTATKA